MSDLIKLECYVNTSIPDTIYTIIKYQAILYKNFCRAQTG